MRRRDFLVTAGGVALAALRPRVSGAAERLHRVGLIVPTTALSDIAGDDPRNPGVRAFVHALRDLGYVEGRTLSLERRSAEGAASRFDELLEELVEHDAEIIVTVGDELALAAKRAARGAPIVMMSSDDPVGRGLAASLARPGGNVTGLAARADPDAEARRFELLATALPGAERIAFLGLAGDWTSPQGAVIRSAARARGIALIHAEHGAADYADAFNMIALYPPHALFVARNAGNAPNLITIVNFALERRLPGSYPYREFVTAGGLMSYSVSLPDLARRAAILIDKILKGARPADIPIESPRKFELTLNQRTARALGVVLPASVLAAADEVID